MGASRQWWNSEDDNKSTNTMPNKSLPGECKLVFQVNYHLWLNPFWEINFFLDYVPFDISKRGGGRGRPVMS